MILNGVCACQMRVPARMCWRILSFYSKMVSNKFKLGCQGRMVSKKCMRYFIKWNDKVIQALRYFMEIPQSLETIHAMETIHDENTWSLFFRACSYGKKLSRLARKHFDKLTSEISPSYENSMKSYHAFIWDEKFYHVPRSRLLIGEISVHGKILDSYERNTILSR